MSFAGFLCSDEDVVLFFGKKEKKNVSFQGGGKAKIIFNPENGG
jgi:hypothetical protein